MPTKVEAYKCSFCGRLLKTEYWAKVHEATCRNNPEKRHCITCKHGVFECILPDLYGNGTVKYGPYCAYFDKPISEEPYFLDCDIMGGVDTGFGPLPENPMPYSCMHYENKGKAEWTRVKGDSR